MSDLFDQPEGATPLSEEDQEGLIPSWIALRADLNTAERDNILAAVTWARDRRWKIEDFTQATLKRIHHQMFADVWRWAGTYRTAETNIGVPFHQISPEVESLLRDIRAQVADHTWEPDEIAVRFHHRLAWIHPFRNGNGRHARMVADLIAGALSRPPFSWGEGADLDSEGGARQVYIRALQNADKGNVAPLLTFARNPRAAAPP